MSAGIARCSTHGLPGVLDRALEGLGCPVPGQVSGARSEGGKLERLRRIVVFGRASGAGPEENSCQIDAARKKEAATRQRTVQLKGTTGARREDGASS